MLETIAAKPVRRVVGLMSGTSVDGIDAALVEITGREFPEIRLRSFENIPYPADVRERIFELFRTENATVDKIGSMNFLLGGLFADAALYVIGKAGLRPNQVDLIGSHGQTIYHCPTPGGTGGPCTVQIGEGAVIAYRTGIPCVSDFRVADVAAGGQGAPLVPFTEYLLYRSETRNVLLQNIGGIGNVTVLPAGCTEAEVFAFDTGPGNMVIDGLAGRLCNGIKMDLGGAIAATGKIHPGLLEQLRADPYFSLSPPKTTGRELFGEKFVESAFRYIVQNDVDPADAVATATYLTAWSIADAYRRFVRSRCRADRMVIGGGGSYNRTLVRDLRDEMADCGVETLTQEEIGQNSDAKEAVAFAVLADWAAAGRVNSLPGVTGAKKAVVMGKISL